MSISPEAGQGLVVKISDPSIQKAGNVPTPLGTLILASNRPYCCENLPEEISRAEVYSQGPYQHDSPGEASLRAVMTRLPLPSVTAFFVV